MMYNNEKDFIISVVQKTYHKYTSQEFNTLQKTDFDLVTNIDLDIEKEISKAIKDQFPSDHILGEEFSHDEEIVGRTWTIDPIDGTCNMAHGIKLYGVQCSLINNNEIVLAVVYLPHFNETIWAIKGKGAYVGEEPISVNHEVLLNNAIVSFGDYPHKATTELADMQHKAIKNLYSKIAKIRMFGAACLDFTCVGQAKTDGTVVITKNLWDICPGILICKEAGALVTNLKGEEYKFGEVGVIASANQELLNLIVESFK